jgi:hypothetical protein
MILLLIEVRSSRAARLAQPPQPRIARNNSPLAATEIAIEPRQPARLEKKKNIHGLR